jgi:hypothetical protein
VILRDGFELQGPQASFYFVIPRSPGDPWVLRPEMGVVRLCRNSQWDGQREFSVPLILNSWSVIGLWCIHDWPAHVRRVCLSLSRSFAVFLFRCCPVPRRRRRRGYSGNGQSSRYSMKKMVRRKKKVRGSEKGETSTRMSPKCHKAGCLVSYGGNPLDGSCPPRPEH